MIKNIYCKITMDKNPGQSKCYVITKDGELIKELAFPFATSNLSEYVCLISAIKEALKDSDNKYNVITSSEIAYKWFTSKRAKNSIKDYDSLSDYEIDFQFNVCFKFNETIKIIHTKDKDRKGGQNTSVTDKNVVIYQVPRRLWDEFTPYDIIHQ